MTFDISLILEKSLGMRIVKEHNMILIFLYFRTHPIQDNCCYQKNIFIVLFINLSYDLSQYSFPLLLGEFSFYFHNTQKKIKPRRVHSTRMISFNALTRMKARCDALRNFPTARMFMKLFSLTKHIH